MGSAWRLKLLLDTHIWLWLFREPKRLGRRTLQILKDPRNELWLSAISTWEILTLHHKGRIKFHVAIAEWIAKATAGTQEAPFTHEITLAARHLPLHQDPADRFLFATAQVLDLTLITADERLLGLGTIRILANR
jgi:PIN domain nuclease of toxin-antitoxin system